MRISIHTIPGIPIHTRSQYTQDLNTHKISINTRSKGSQYIYARSQFTHYQGSDYTQDLRDPNALSPIPDNDDDAQCALSVKA